MCVDLSKAIQVSLAVSLLCVCGEREKLIVPKSEKQEGLYSLPSPGNRTKG